MSRTKNNIKDNIETVDLENEELFEGIDIESIDFEPEELYTEDISELLTDMSAQKSSATLFRDDVIREICSILISENKPNALLIGPAGFHCPSTSGSQ